MKKTADSVRRMIDLLELTAEREMRVWGVLLPGRDTWRLFAEYRDFCTEEQRCLIFVQSARNQVERMSDPARREMVARIGEVERRIRLAAAAVHRRYLEALSEPGVPLPVGSAEFLRQRLAVLNGLPERIGQDWRRPLRELASSLVARAHDLRDFGGQA
ncbi:hypothetical protein [Indioceanicola profundi]|uniref:hypothetical protein n=1 Tax=Indioceanicola profundi TaxID=2220096 RepID=UPI000E6AA640|nr:hypothetical protein [Indioceanicola profundi]